MSSIQRAAVALAACASLFPGARAIAADAPRPRDPWVFRSALDGRARMLTVALSDRLYITYDTQHATLARAWHDGVHFTGGVYDARHGPQPTSIGRPYFKAPADGTAWTLTHAGQPVDAKPRYLGYTVADNRVTVRFSIDAPAGRVTIDESPDVGTRDGNGTDVVTLDRTFTVAGLPDGATLHLSLEGSPDDRPTEHSVDTDAATVTTINGPATTQPVRQLRITKNGVIRLSTSWRPQ